MREGARGATDKNISQNHFRGSHSTGQPSLIHTQRYQGKRHTINDLSHERTYLRWARRATAPAPGTLRFVAAAAAATAAAVVVAAAADFLGWLVSCGSLCTSESERASERERDLHWLLLLLTRLYTPALYLVSAVCGRASE